MISPLQMFVGDPQGAQCVSVPGKQIKEQQGTPRLSPLSIQAAMALRNCLGPSRVPECSFC